MSDSIKIIFKKLDKSFKYHQNDMKTLDWQTKCLLNIANYLGVKITEQGDVYSRKSNLDLHAEQFYPKSEVTLNQIDNRVKNLSNKVAEVDSEKVFPAKIRTKQNYG